MSLLRDFVATLARAGKIFKDIQETVAAVYGDRSLKKTQIYAIIKNVKEGKLTTDQWKLNDRRKIRLLPMSPPTSIRIGALQSGDSLWPMACQKTPSTACSSRI
jgi:hypothetical protein